MTDFLNAPFNYILENCDVRDYKGFHQHRETLLEVHLTKKISLRLKTPWTFLVTALGDEENRAQDSCFVTKSDGSYEEVQIDHKNHITIAGKKYTNWISYH